MAAVRAVAPAPETDVQSDAYLYWLRGLLGPARVEPAGGPAGERGAGDRAPGRVGPAVRLAAGLGRRGPLGRRPGRGPAGRGVPGQRHCAWRGRGSPARSGGGPRTTGCRTWPCAGRTTPSRGWCPGHPAPRAGGLPGGAPGPVGGGAQPGHHQAPTGRPSARAFTAAGVPYYWLVDWRRRRVAVLTRPAGGNYAAEGTVALAALRWPPEDPDAPRWGDHPHFPRG